MHSISAMEKTINNDIKWQWNKILSLTSAPQPNLHLYKFGYVCGEVRTRDRHYHWPTDQSCITPFSYNCICIRTNHNQHNPNDKNYPWTPPILVQSQLHKSTIAITITPYNHNHRHMWHIGSSSKNFQYSIKIILQKFPICIGAFPSIQNRFV